MAYDLTPPDPAILAAGAESAKNMSQSYKDMKDSMDLVIQQMLSINNVSKANELIAVKVASENRKETVALTTKLRELRSKNQIDRDGIKNAVEALKNQQKSLDLSRTAAIAENNLSVIVKNRANARKAEGRTIDEINQKLEKQQKIEEQAEKSAQHQQIATSINKAGALAQGALQATPTAVRGGIAAGGGMAGAGLGMLFGVPPLIGAAVGDAVTGTLTSILDIFGGKFTKQASGIAKAMAGGGDFSKGAHDIQAMSRALMDFTGLHGGLTLTELTNKMQELGKAGVKLSSNMGENVQKVIQFNAYANAMGISVGELGTLTVGLRRTLRGANSEGEVSEKLARVSQTMVHADIMQQGEFISMISSVSDSFSELGTKFETTVNIVRDLSLNVKHLGVSSKVAKEITMQLTGSFKATGDEWKAFMGAKTGAGGGFLGGLFSAQQRGPGGDLLNREADPRKFMQGVMTTIKGQTAGIADPRAKMYMAETLGKNFGLDAKSTQALLKGVLGSTSDQEEALDDLANASQQAEEAGKDWADKLAALLEKWVTTPLKEIRDLLMMFRHPFDAMKDIFTTKKGAVTAGKAGAAGIGAGLGGWGGWAGGAAAGAAIGSVVPVLGTAVGGIAGGILGAAAGGIGGGMIGGGIADAALPSYKVGVDYVPEDGPAYLHKGEKVVPAGGSGGISVSIGNISLGGGDARSQSQAIGKAVQEESYKQIMKYHETMYGQG